ncbi:MAG: hypothetical protein Q9227_000584 [Pyrenula ochraceoflavens]
MVDTSQAATALLTEHLQYTPLSLIDDIINSVNELVYQGISSLENGLTSTPPDRLGFKPAPAPASDPQSLPDTDSQTIEYPEAKKEIEEGLHQLETLLESTVDKNFDKFEIYVLRNILCVPDGLESWVRLRHYEDLPTRPSTEGESTPNVEALHLLRRKLTESMRLRRALRVEATQNEAIIRQLKSIVGADDLRKPATSPLKHIKTEQPDFSFLTSSTSASTFKLSPTNSSLQPLTTNTKFVLSQLPALRSLLAELRPRLTALRNAPMSIESAADERREERRRYIDQRVRLHVDRDGDTRMSEGDASRGKKTDPDEIAALERVARMFES